VRLVSSGRRTILFDEIDGVFGNSKAQEANVDLRSVLNGGYRRGAKVHRCTTHGKKVETEELDAFAAVAVAGLRTLPDTLASRSIFIHMRRRAPDEHVEPFRHRHHSEQATPIREALVEWCNERNAGLVDPDLPEGIQDRAADCWEPLLVVADEAGGDWPARARAAAVNLTQRSTDESMTAGVELLAHIRDAFEDDAHLATVTLLEQLRDRDESPWKDVYGKPLDDRGLAKRLKAYGIESKTVRIGEGRPKAIPPTTSMRCGSDIFLPLPLVRETGATAATLLITKTILWRTLRPLRLGKPQRQSPAAKLVTARAALTAARKITASDLSIPSSTGGCG